MKSLSFATLSFATLGVLASVGAAMAADLPVKAPRAPVASPVAYDWTGFYVGGNVGVAWLDKSVTEVSTSGGSLANPPPFSQSLTAPGFSAGLQAGYNWQVQSWVFGVEADFNWVHIDKTVPAIGSPDSGLDDFLRGKADWFATFRGRIGYAFDRWMPYFTGGAVLARLTNEYGDTDPDDFASVKKARWGWTIGGGIETAFAPNWTAKFEYLFMDFKPFLALAIDGTDPDPVEFKDRMHVLRIGLNYKFGAPIVARY